MHYSQPNDHLHRSISLRVVNMSRQPSVAYATLRYIVFFRCVLLISGQCDDGKCVALAKCTSNFGQDIVIDPRVGNGIEGECDHYLEVCCAEEDIIEEIPGSSGRETVTEPPKFMRCGVRNPAGVGFRTVHAAHNETEFGEFPWMVAILESEQLLGEISQTFICGGSLIAPNVVLTAAHCVRNKNLETLTARAGEWDTQTENEIRPYQEQNAKQIIIQPHYNSATQFNNVALVVLENSFAADDNVQLACLPPYGTSFTDNNCYATGWGKSEFSSQSYQVILKKVKLPMVAFSDCQQALRRTRLGSNFRLHNSFTCAGGEDGVDTCTGDGGSPLMCPFEGSESRYFQAGIVSWGIGCGTPGVPGVYVKNSMFTQWIVEELQKLGTEIEIEEY